VDIGGTPTDRVQQHLVDEADDGRVVGVRVEHGLLVDVAAAQLLQLEILQPARGGVEVVVMDIEEACDLGAEFVELDHHQIHAHAGLEADFVERAVIRGIA